MGFDLAASSTRPAQLASLYFLRVVRLWSFSTHGFVKILLPSGIYHESYFSWFVYLEVMALTNEPFPLEATLNDCMQRCSDIQFSLYRTATHHNMMLDPAVLCKSTE